MEVSRIASPLPGAPFARPVLAQKINVEFDQAAGFTKYQTDGHYRVQSPRDDSAFAIRNGQLNSPNPAPNRELANKNLEADIVRALTARGLTQVEHRPELNVRYQSGSVRRLETEACPAGWRGLGTRLVRVPYSEGTLVIDLRDPATRALVWRAIASESSGKSRRSREAGGHTG
jgi:hypothetical protein